MIRKAKIFKVVRKPFEVQPFQIRRRFFRTVHQQEKSYSHHLPRHPEGLKEMTDEEFHKYHKNYYKRVFKEKMPPNLLQKQEFTVFQMDQHKRLFWRYYYSYYIQAVVGLISAWLAYHYWRSTIITEFQEGGLVSDKEARFMEVLLRFREYEAFESYKELKKISKLQFSRSEACRIFDVDYVSFMRKPKFWTKSELFDF